jgi:hypothetical protein
MFSSLVSNGFYGAFKSWLTSTKQKDIIIDPMSCMIKLAVLSFYPPGTKISIFDNKIHFNSPTIFQGTIRYFKSDNREDLHNLFNPIQKSIQWYWNEKDEGIVYLFILAINGLKILKHSYPSHSTIQYTLDYYINLLVRKEIDGISVEIDKQLGSALASASASIISKSSNKKDKDKILEKDIVVEPSPSPINPNNNLVYSFLKGLWNKRELFIMIELLKEYKSKTDEEGYNEEEANAILSSIDSMTDIKDTKLYNFLLEHTTIL